MMGLENRLKSKSDWAQNGVERDLGWRVGWATK